MAAPQPPGALAGGVGVALVTYFDGGRPDVARTVERAVRCAEAKMGTILVAGTTGEASRLDAAQRIELAAAVKAALPDVPVLVGTGDPVSARALALSAEVAAAKVADGLLVLAAGDRTPRDYYAAVRAAAPGVTLLAYHHPPASPPGIETAAVPTLEVDAIKDSSGSTNRLAALVEGGARVYVGSPTLLAIAGGCGAVGALVGLGNVAPTLCIDAWNGDMAAQRRLFTLHERVSADWPGFLKAHEPDEV